MELCEAMRALLAETLGLPAERAGALTMESPLFGALPELDSMAVASVLTAMEDRFDILIDDDDIDAEAFETFGNLTNFVATKLANAAR